MRPPTPHNKSMNISNCEIEFLMSLTALMAKGFLALLIFIFIMSIQQ